MTWWESTVTEVCHLGSHHLAVDGLVDRLDQRLGARGGDREVLLGALTAVLHQCGMVPAIGPAPIASISASRVGGGEGARATQGLKRSVTEGL